MDSQHYFWLHNFTPIIVTSLLVLYPERNNIAALELLSSAVHVCLVLDSATQILLLFTLTSKKGLLSPGWLGHNYGCGLVEARR